MLISCICQNIGGWFISFIFKKRFKIYYNAFNKSYILFWAFFSIVVPWCFRTNILNTEHDQIIQTCSLEKYRQSRPKGRNKNGVKMGSKKVCKNVIDFFTEMSLRCHWFKYYLPWSRDFILLNIICYILRLVFIFKYHSLVVSCVKTCAALHSKTLK